MKVFIFFKERQDIIEYLKRIVKELLSDGYEIYMDSRYNFLPENEFKYHILDVNSFKGIVIVLGGDGTILKAAKKVNPYSLILGVNFGVRGFLTEINPKDLKRSLEQIKRGEFLIDERIKLEVKYRNKTFECLNEVALITSRPAKLCVFKIYLNEIFIDEVQADGILVATPTGSTAYSLSAGGPIIDPRAKVFIINYICPFRLSIRPIIYPHDLYAKIEFTKNNEVENVYLTVDGEILGTIKQGEAIKIKKSERTVKFIRFGKDYYKKVRELLI